MRIIFNILNIRFLSILYLVLLGTLPLAAQYNVGSPSMATGTILNDDFPSVTSVARADASPTNATTINFTVTFSHAVTGVDATDFTLTKTGTADGSIGTPTTSDNIEYNVPVSSVVGNGTLRLDVTDDNTITNTGQPIGGASANDGDFTSGEVYTIDNVLPTVSSIVRTDANPTNATSVDFTVTFSESVTGVASADFAIDQTGLTGAMVTGVNGSGTTYTVTVSTGTGDGTLSIDFDADAAGGATDGAGNVSTADFTTGEAYTIDKTLPTVSSIVRTDANPTNATSVDFTVTFSESVTGVTTADFVIDQTGLTGAMVTGVNGSGTTYTITVGTGTGDGTLSIDFDADAAGGVSDGVGNVSTGDFTGGETYSIDKTAPISISFTRKTPSLENTNADALTFLATFSEDVTGVGSADFSVTGPTGASIGVAQVTASTYDVTISGGDMAGLDATVGLNFSSPSITDLAGNALPNNEPATDETYNVDNTAPTVTINKGAGQADPTENSPILFDIEFSENIVGFVEGDINLGGTTGANMVMLSGSGTTYTASVTGMNSNGDVIASIAANAVTDAAGNPSEASTSTDNQVTFVTAPIIELSANSNAIANGANLAAASVTNGTSFGNVCSVGGSANVTYTITNSGTADLDLTGSPLVALSGHTSDFMVTTQPMTDPVPHSMGNTTTFVITFDPTIPGERSATVSIASNDSDKTPFTFVIKGTGDALATPSMAGSDQSKCSEGTFTMAANVPTVGTGMWSEVTSTGVVIAMPASNTTNVSGLAAGTSATLRWTISSGNTCPATQDDVVITNEICCPPTNVIYVDVNTPNSNDGSDWNNAYADLQEALSKLGTCPLVDEVWVADGTYHPTTGTDRTASFSLKNNVAIYGGFAGGETMLTARDWSANPTVLSGDIGIAADNSDNSYHVVRNNNTVNTNAVLDGFTITGGNANKLLNETAGAGMLNNGASPTVRNCTFTANTALSNGGGVQNIGGSTPHLSQCTFSTNTAANGAGIANEGGSTATVDSCNFSANVAGSNGGAVYNNASSPSFTGCTFTGNSSSGAGGAMANLAASSPVITGSSFTGNMASGFGGGVYSTAGSIAALTNCTLLGNSASFGGGLYCTSSNVIATNASFHDNTATHGGGVYSSVSTPVLTNCIVWGNNAGTEINGAATVSYSIVKGGHAGTRNLNQDPQFISATDLRIHPCSPAVNSGDNTANTTMVDIGGNARVVSSIIDMGAFESQLPASATVTWTGNGDGSSWGDAGNWNTGFLPGKCQDILISTGNNVSVNAGTNALGKTLEVQNGAALTTDPTAIMEIKN